MKKRILSLVLASTALTDASTVILSSSSSAPSVYTFSGALVPNGSFVRVGMFTDPTNPSTFVEFGTSILSNGGVGAGTKPSKLQGAVVNSGGVVGNAESDDSQFNGKDVYVWIYNATTADPAADSGIFKATLVGTAVNTTFPVDDPTVTSDALTYHGLQFTQYIPNPTILGQGRFDGASPANADGTGLGRLILGGVIPEPSSAGLIAFAGLSLARRPKRRQ